MQPFPTSDELANFVGDEIVQIWLDPWGVRFLFGSGVQLYVEGGYEHTEPSGTLWAYDCDAANGPAVLIQRLLYRPIMRVERDERRLTLSMDDGAKLSIISELGPFESGQISWPDGRMSIF